MSNSQTEAPEGVIKFRLKHTQKPPRHIDNFNVLNAWRKLMFKLDLIGCDPGRYGGYGFGNISHKIDTDHLSLKTNENTAFLISGTQTGHLPQLAEEHYAVITEANSKENLIVAEGPIEPSSETLTHAAVYATDQKIRWVIHVHCPEIWRHADRLSIPSIASNIPYGTPQMATAVGQLLVHHSIRKQAIFSMQGHQDGVVCFGATAEQAGLTIIKYLALGVAFKNDHQE